ncbi:MAG: thioesterase family protein [Firmicutes bacterium]|nr:thioesterase family protein [Bacillota bacterium]
MIGNKGVAKTVVGVENTAKAVGSGSLEVFSTPMMIALMEQAACVALADVLEVGQSSVGTQIAVEHTAASAVGANIVATATITAVDGKKISFEVVANDDKNQIGKGTHTRFIIDIERFMAKVGN